MNTAFQNPKPAMAGASLDEILFEHGNRQYGAYAIRVTGTNRLLASFAATGIVIIAAMLYFILSGGPSGDNLFIIPAETDSTFIQEVELLEKKEEKKEDVLIEKKTETVIKREEVENTAKFLTPVPDSVETDSTAKDVSVLDTASAGDRDSKGGGTYTDTTTGTKNIKGNETVIKKDSVYDWTGSEIAGTPPQAMNLKDLSSLIRYPEALKEMGIKGSVALKVLVDENGNYVRHEVLKTTHPLFAKECEKYISKLRFSPGKMGEQAVKVWVIVPLKFTLSN